MCKKNKRFLLGLVGTLSLLLAACGGGGGGGGNDASQGMSNQAPTVSLSPISVREGESATLKVSASDADGSIASYAWVQKSGVALELSGVDTDTVSIKAPDVAKDSEATLVVTVTDNDGASTTVEVTISILAEMLNVTVKGIVSDNPVANAQVIINVGEQEFTTTSDANGNFTISVTVDASQHLEMVRAEATSQDPRLKLVSLMGDVDTLINAAGEDTVLTRDEYLPVVISNLSTAMAAQLEQGEPGSIATQEQLSDRKKALNGSHLFNVGILIKLVLDYSDSLEAALLENITNTYDLAADLEYASKLASDIQISNAALYQQALEAMAADQNLVKPVLANSAAIQDTYYLTSASLISVPFDGAALTHLGHRLEIVSEGVGELVGSNGAMPLTWTTTAAGLEIDGAEFVVRANSNYDDALGKYVDQEDVVRLVRINWLDHADDVDWLLITAEELTRYPNGEYPSTEPVTVNGASIAIRKAGAGDLKQALQMGLALSIPLPRLEGKVTAPSSANPDAYLDVMSAQLVFAGNVDTGGSVTISQDSISGQGVPSSTQVSSAWTIDANGRLQITSVFGHSVAVTLLGNGNLKSPVVFVETNDGVEKASTIGKAFLKDAPSWSPASAVGIYRYPPDLFSPLQPFWFEVNADGTALTVSGIDYNSDGVLGSDEFSLMPGLWQINAEGNLVIRRYRSPTAGFCESVIWDPAPSEDCVLFHEREWVLHQDDASGDIGLRHYHRFFMDPFLDRSTTIPTEHSFNFGTIGNISYQRIEERPFTIPPL